MYRKGVAAVITDGEGKILAYRRKDHPESWQFPQGGIENGENEEEALKRELWEECGIKRYRILSRTPPISYALNLKSKGMEHEGQSHVYFLLELEEDIPSVPDCEFTECAWMTGPALLGWCPSFKKDAIRQAISILLPAEL